MTKRLLLCLWLAIVSASADPAERPLRWSSAGDVLSFDFHAVADFFSTGVGGQIYEGLVRRGKDTKFEPALAEFVEGPLIGSTRVLGQDKPVQMVRIIHCVTPRSVL